MVKVLLHRGRCVDIGNLIFIKTIVMNDRLEFLLKRPFHKIFIVFVARKWVFGKIKFHCIIN